MFQKVRFGTGVLVQMRLSSLKRQHYGFYYCYGIAIAHRLQKIKICKAKRLKNILNNFPW